MIATFLGTGTSQGVPVIACECEVCRSVDFRDKRTRSAIHFNADGKSLVVDTGPDFRQQMLRERIKRLDAVLFTHEHKDHTAGLDDIRAYNYVQKGDIPLYAHQRVIEHLKKEFEYVFSGERYPGIPQVDTVEIENKPFTAAGIKINPIEVQHFKLPVFGFRIGDFTYITDANKIPEAELDKVKGSRFLVLNALRREAHISHFTLDEALEVAATIGAERTFLTHISHQLGKHRDVEKELPKNVELAFDGLKVEF